MNRITASLLLLCAIALVATQRTSQAAAIASRGELHTLLGGQGTLEDFESFDVEPGDATRFDDLVLDSNSIIKGQGPGLVVPGLRFLLRTVGGSGEDGGQWNGTGYYGAPSKELLRDSGTRPLVIDFTSAVYAFGLDLRAYTGYGATATVTVFGADDVTQIGILTPIPLLAGGIPVFAGYRDSVGIGRVEFTQTWRDWSPIIDNLEFATVPEPSTLALAALGALGLLIAARRRR